MDGEQSWTCLQLDHKPIVDQEVESCLADGNAFVGEGNRNLSAERNASKSKLDGQCPLVHRFEKAGAQGTMNLERGIEYSRSSSIERQIRFSFFGVPGALAVHNLGYRRLPRTVA